MEGLTIRQMERRDLSFAAGYTAAEGWMSEDLATFEGFYQHEPAGCLLAELDSQPVGICIATWYGQSGFIGELIVRPDCRRHGIGAALFDYAITHLHCRGAKTVYLDGVLKAVPLYERFGFRKICRSLRFAGKVNPRSHTCIRPMQYHDLSTICSLDRQAFAADRSYFLARRLELYPELCWVLVEADQITGFIQGRQGEDWIAAGPWVISEAAGAPERLLEILACQGDEKTLYLGVLESNHRAVELVHSLGFEERPDSPWRMALGPCKDLGASPMCLAIGSAAKG